MGTGRRNLGLVCLPSNRGLITIGGSNGSPLDVVEHLAMGEVSKWARLPSLPKAVERVCAAYFGDTIFVADCHASDVFTYKLASEGGCGDWVRIKTPNFSFPSHMVICRNQLFVLGEAQVHKLKLFWLN